MKLLTHFPNSGGVLSLYKYTKNICGIIIKFNKMFRVKDYLNNGNEYDHFFTVRRKRILVDLFHSNIKDFIKDSCFYYSSSADATPIIGCFDC